MALSSGIIAILVLGISSLFILGFAGYAQRLLFTLLITWMILVSAHLIRFPREEITWRPTT
jgi:predicted lipid-binding transport protein (Tim44 family)